MYTIMCVHLRMCRVYKMVSGAGSEINLRFRSRSSASTSLLNTDNIIYRGEYFDYSSGEAEPVVRSRKWNRWSFHYDDVAQAMMTLFTVQSGEGWPALVQLFWYHFLSFLFRGTFIVWNRDKPVAVERREWLQHYLHYDNIYEAGLTLFVVQSTEGWPG